MTTSRDDLLLEARKIAAEAKFETDLCLRIASDAEADAIRSMAERLRNRDRLIGHDRNGPIYEELDDPRAHHGHARRTVAIIHSAEIIPFNKYRRFK